MTIDKKCCKRPNLNITIKFAHPAASKSKVRLVCSDFKCQSCLSDREDKESALKEIVERCCASFRLYEQQQISVLTVRVSSSADPDDELTIMNNVTENREPYFSSTSRARRLIVSTLVLLLPYSLVATALAINIWLRNLSEEIESGFFYWGAKCLLALATQGVITVLDSVFRKLSEPLAYWENHRKTAEREGTLLVRSFFFQCINSYTVILYVAFWADSGDNWARDVNVQVLGQMVSIPLLSFLKKFLDRRVTTCLLRHEAKSHVDIIRQHGSIAKCCHPASSERLSLQNQILMPPYPEVQQEPFKDLCSPTLNMLDAGR